MKVINQKTKKCRECETDLVVNITWNNYRCNKNDFICNSCLNIKNSEYYLKNKEIIKERKRKKYIEDPSIHLDRSKQWRKDNPDGRFNAHLKHTYGIDIKCYKSMLISQNYVCCICNNPETCVDNRTNIVKRLSVDHCHETGKVRGLLCSNCNKGLGMFSDSILNFKSAIKYLQKAKKAVK